MHINKTLLLLGLIGMASSANAAVININNFSATPDGSTTTFSQGTNVNSANGNSNILTAGTGTELMFVVTTFTFGTSSDAHLQAGFSTSTAPTSTNRLAIRVEDTGQVTWQGSGDGSRTSYNFAQDMAGQTVTILMKFDFDTVHSVEASSGDASQDTWANAWINPTLSSVEGTSSSRTAGDMGTFWNSSSFAGFAQMIYNQSTPGTSGISSINNTTVLTGTDATFANALALATVPEPSATLLGMLGSLLLFRRRRN